jgi:CPA2 family monovalent cation:H+ antiporter-2
MPHHTPLIATIVIGLVIAFVLGAVANRLRISPLVGYVLAGVAVGPYTPGFVADQWLASQLAEIGVILLMFGVGLTFHLDELLAVRRVAIPGALAQSAVATILGMVLARAFGWDWAAGVVFGMALAVASTVVLIRVLADHNDLHTPGGHIAVGWLVVEDLFTVVALVLLPALFGPAASESPLWMSLTWTALKVALLVGFTALVGVRVIPRVLDHVARTRSRELFTLAVLVIALGIAVGAAIVFSVSMALGAFLAGMVVGRSEYSVRAASEALPMRDAFAVLFFVSVGMLLDPAELLEAPGIIFATLAVVLVGKPLAALIVVRLLRYPFAVAAAVSVALAQIGEFSFILGALGRQLGLLPEVAVNTLVAVAIVSIVINPPLYRLVKPLERAARRHGWLWRLLDPNAGDVSLEHRAPVDASHRAVVVGYGPTGRTLTRLLRDNAIAPSIIEMNMETVRALKEGGTDAVYGDASQRDTLRAAGVEQAASLVLTTDLPAAAEVIRIARELRPGIRILARTSYLRDRDKLRNAGADEVFAGEGEVALALTEALLHRLGATPEQIDRERERVHAELFEPTESPTA